MGDLALHFAVMLSAFVMLAMVAAAITAISNRVSITEVLKAVFWRDA